MARVLFITQKVDQDDDLLGIYHKWIEKLAEKVGSISVICLQKGNFDLPNNVRVFSLGKEQYLKYPRIIRRLMALFRFYKYIWQLRKRYDVVFVHMNSEYVILGSVFWKLFNKKIILWHAHYLPTLKLKIASWLADKIATSVRQAYPLESRKLEVLQQGIDIEQFKPKIRNPKSQNKEFKILFLGRISPVKNLEVLLRAFDLVGKKNRNVFLTIVGSPTPGKEIEKQYYEKMQKLAADLNLDGKAEFKPAVPNHRTPEIYNQHDLFVNLTDTGSFDKTTLEAMACGLLILVSNKAFEKLLPQNLAKSLIFKEKDYRDLAEKIVKIIGMDAGDCTEMKDLMRKIIIKEHCLSNLIDRLVFCLNDNDKR